MITQKQKHQKQQKQFTTRRPNTGPKQKAPPRNYEEQGFCICFACQRNGTRMADATLRRLKQIWDRSTCAKVEVLRTNLRLRQTCDDRSACVKTEAPWRCEMWEGLLEIFKEGRRPRYSRKDGRPRDIQEGTASSYSRKDPIEKLKKKASLEISRAGTPRDVQDGREGNLEAFKKRGHPRGVREKEGTSSRPRQGEIPRFPNT